MADKYDEKNNIRLQARVFGTLKLEVKRDLDRGYKPCEIVKSALSFYYKNRDKSGY